MPSARVAAIVPVFNRPCLVLEALDSVAGQTRLPDRLVVVDDGSTDATPDALRRWAAEHPGIATEIIRQANRGAAAARNRGAATASDAEILAWLDSDDLWPPDYLERMRDALARDSGLVAATCDRLDLEGTAGRRLRRFDRLGQATTRRIFVGGSPGPPNTVFRAEAFRRTGGYDEKQSSLEDYRLMLRLSRLGSWGYAPGRPVVVRRDCGRGDGEAPHLSRKDPGWRRREALILEAFVHGEGGHQAIPERFWKPRLAYVWYKAGRQLEKAGHPAEASDCFEKVLRLTPGHLRARFHRRRLSRALQPPARPA